MLMGSQHQDEDLKKTRRKNNTTQSKHLDISEKIKILKEKVQSGFYGTDEVIEKVVLRLTEEI